MDTLKTIAKTLIQNYRNHRAVFQILAVGLVVRLAIAMLWFAPGFDEAYYYLYTINPAWSYFDHPPLVALTTAFGVWASGGEVSAFSIRFGSVLLYTVTLFALYRAARHLFSQRVGMIALLIGSIAPIFTIAFGIMTLPDGPLMLFWTLTLWLAAVEFFPDQNDDYKPTSRLAWIGLLVGLATCGKYHGFFLGAGLVGFCLTSKRHRSALLSPWIVAALGLFCLAISPVIIWNAQHEWASIAFQAERGLPSKGFSLAKLLNVGLVESLFLFPTIGLPLWMASLAALAQQLLRPRTTETIWLQRRLVLWLSAPVFLLFTLIGGYRAVLPTWSMPGLFVATILLAEWAATWPRKAVGRWLGGSAIAVATILAIALSHISFGTLQVPSKTAMFGGIVKIQDDSSLELIHIEQLRRSFQRLPAMMQALRESDFIFTNRFHLSGHVGMALHPLGAKPVTCFDARDMRGFAFWSKSKDWVGKSGLYLTTKAYQNIEEDSAMEYAPYFQRLTKIGEIPLVRGGIEVDRIFVYQGKTMLKSFPRPEKATRGA
jgi:Dolichyl-phosphate-mannose-protein mannosyltransferase